MNEINLSASLVTQVRRIRRAAHQQDLSVHPPSGGPRPHLEALRLSQGPGGVLQNQEQHHQQPVRPRNILFDGVGDIVAWGTL